MFRLPLGGIIKLLDNHKKGTEAINADTKARAEKILNAAIDEITKLRQDTENSQNSLTAAVQNKLQQSLAEARSLITEARAAMPKDGKDADPAAVVPLVLEQIKLPENKPFILTGEDILDALDALPDDVGIDAKRIKNLPDPKNYHLFGGSTSRVVTVKHAGSIISKLFRSVNFCRSRVSATSDMNGNITVTINGTSVNEFNGEVLTDSGNHTTFTFAHTLLASELSGLRKPARCLP